MLHSTEFHSSFCLPLTWSMCSTKCPTNNSPPDHIHALLYSRIKALAWCVFVSATQLLWHWLAEFFLAQQSKWICVFDCCHCCLWLKSWTGPVLLVPEAVWLTLLHFTTQHRPALVSVLFYQHSSCNGVSPNHTLYNVSNFEHEILLRRMFSSPLIIYFWGKNRDPCSPTDVHVFRPRDN